MIEIIKNGVIPKIEHVCSFCNCKFTYQEEDKKFYINQYDHISGAYIKCPNCLKTIWLF